MSMFGWNNNIDPSSSPAGAPSSSGHQQQQQLQRPLRWLPSALTRTPNGSTTSSSPTIRTLRPTTLADDNATLTTVPVLNESSLSSESPNLGETGGALPHTILVGDAGQPKSAERKRRGRPPILRSGLDGALPVTAVTTTATTTSISAPDTLPPVIVNADDDPTTNTTPRTKRGRLLTSTEETSLFQICNRHASTFGEHDRLCQWWATVTSEFTSETGHPYSWHSVRRKVELVTKQRIKFLATLREGGAGVGAAGVVDRAEGAWARALEEWIPAWERFQEQEAQRSAGKGWRRGRKRKTAEVGLEDGETQQQQLQTQAQAPQVNDGEGFDGAVQLPSGFDSIFGQNQKCQSGSSGPTMAKSKGSAAKTADDRSGGGAVGADSSISAAILETLSKLNRNLDARSSPITALPATPLQHTPSLDNHTGNNIPTPSAFGRNNPTINDLRQELKQELKEELKQELREEFHREMQKDRAQLEERLETVQRTHQMILELLQHEP